LVGALYEEFSALLEDLGRLEAFFGQLRPVIGKPLAEEEAEALRLSMLEHLPQRPLRLGEVRVRLERAWCTGALPPGVERRGLAVGRVPVRRLAAAPKDVGEGRPGPQELPFVGAQGDRRPRGRLKGSKAKVNVASPDGQSPALQATFVWA
jgi:hypothetical protein